MQRLSQDEGVNLAGIKRILELEAELEGLKRQIEYLRAFVDPGRRIFTADPRGDVVAVNLGSKHKQTRKVSRLDLERLATIAALVPQPLVLHGSSGVTAGDLGRAVALGVAKVNVATELMQVFTEGVRESLTPSVHDPRTYLGAARDRMREKARQLIRLLGCTDKAA